MTDHCENVLGLMLYVHAPLSEAFASSKYLSHLTGLCLL